MNENNKPKLSIIVPVHNEAENIHALVYEIHHSISSWSTFELIIVNDCSSDNTLMVLQNLRQKWTCLRVLSHSTNKGQSTAICSGIQSAKYPTIVTLDGDGQNNPADIIKLYHNYIKYNPACTMVVGYRKKRNDTFLRRFSSRIANDIRGKLLGDHCPDTGCGLKLFPRQLFLSFPQFNHYHRFFPALAKRAGATIINVEVDHRPRTRGQSHYGVFNRLGVGMIDLLGVMWLIRRPCQPEIESGN